MSFKRCLYYGTVESVIIWTFLCLLCVANLTFLNDLMVSLSGTKYMYAIWPTFWLIVIVLIATIQVKNKIKGNVP